MRSSNKKPATKTRKPAARPRAAEIARRFSEAELNAATRPLTAMTPHFATKANTRFVPGRREWLQYLDAGIAEASQGRMRVTRSSASQAMSQETGWHYHECEIQLGFITQGWIELQYEDGTEIRLEAGDFMFVPGGVKHNELRTSTDLAGLEVTLPANMGTVPCERPLNWKAKRRAAARRPRQR
jgi:uncharacterized RmlC-like cupin family protein